MTALDKRLEDSSTYIAWAIFRDVMALILGLVAILSMLWL